MAAAVFHHSVYCAVYKHQHGSTVCCPEWQLAEKRKLWMQQIKPYWLRGLANVYSIFAVDCELSLDLVFFLHYKMYWLSVFLVSCHFLQCFDVVGLRQKVHLASKTTPPVIHKVLFWQTFGAAVKQNIKSNYNVEYDIYDIKTKLTTQKTWPAGCVSRLFYYAPAPRVGDIKRWCSSDVCLSRTSGLSREQRGLGRLKLAQR